MAVTVCMPVVNSALTLRQYAKTDYDAVGSLLLPTLSALYPGGASWLERRLTEVQSGGPKCHLAFVHDELAGALIETPKPGQRTKISTLFVAPKFRRGAIGRRLIQFMRQQWHNEVPTEVYITAALRVANDVERCISLFEFQRIALLPNRYGPGRDEVVFAWRP